jgi:hypothetical protein
LPLVGSRCGTGQRSWPRTGERAIIGLNGMSAPERRIWAWLSILGGVLLLGGEVLHPPAVSGLPEGQLLATQLGDPLWIPAHVLSLAGLVVLLIGMIAFVRSLTAGDPALRGLSTGARRAAVWVRLALGLSVIQAIPHLAAFLDRDELLTGQTTPVVFAYYALAGVAYPLFGFSVAALALLSGQALTHPVVNAVVALIAVAFGLAPLLYPLTLYDLADIPGLELLFYGAAAVALWFVLIGITAVIPRSSPAQHRPNAP